MVELFESVDDAKRKADPKKALEDAVANSLNRIGRKFIVMSGKGGVGKTSTAVNLALALSLTGANVGIIDVDLHGPDVPRMLGLKDMMNVNQKNELVPLAYSDHLRMVSVESLIPNKDDAIIWRGPVKHSVIQQFIGQVSWGDLDYLVIDAPPGTGDEPLTVAQSIKDAEAIIVTTPQEVSLADVRKSINFCHTVKMKIFGMIENMGGFKCPHCDCDIELFGTGGGERTATAMGIDFLGRIPFDPQMVICGDEGVSFQEKYPESQVSIAFHHIAERISSQTART